MVHTAEKNTDSSDMVEGERGSVNDDSETQDLPHPCPDLSELFGSENGRWRMRCLVLAPKKHELLAFKNSPSNLKAHCKTFFTSFYHYCS